MEPFKKAVLALSTLLILFFVYNLFYLGRTYPNLYLGENHIGGLSRSELAVVTGNVFWDLAKRPIVFEVVEIDGSVEKIQTDLEMLGFTFDDKSTAVRAWKVGRSGNLGLDWVAKLSFLVRKQIDPVYQIDWAALVLALDDLLAKHIKPAHDATITFEKGDWQIVRAESGQTIDLTKISADLREKIGNFSDEPIKIMIIEEKPQVSSEKAVKALEKVKTLAEAEITLSWEHDNWQMAGQALFSILKFYPQGLADGYFIKFDLGGGDWTIKNVWWAGYEPPELEVGLEMEALDKFVDGIAASINQERTDARIVFEGGKVREFTPAVDGRLLDATLTKKAISQAVSVENVADVGNIVINLPVKINRAKIESAEIASLGIRELVGSGVSYFAGSIPNRVYNITLAAKRISGTLLAPGETFSFNKIVGEISGATGYRQAYVISAGRTVLDDGGGVCQVSTTIFRAALNAGLPIVARTAHAYRVAYYEQRGFKPGFDATVWAPAVDLAFKNDTDHHLLVQAVVDPANAKLQVDIYGTTDGRRVEITEPALSNFKAAPEDRYQEDPQLPKGTVKQVDFKAAGVTSVFGRKVYKGNQLVIDETFKSIFRPWQAVYLVGIGT